VTLEPLTKPALLERIVASRRELERVLFHEVEGDEDPGFISRLRFSPDELAQPGVAGDWSARRLLAHLAHVQLKFLAWRNAVWIAGLHCARAPQFVEDELGETPPPETDPGAGPLDRLLEHFAARHRQVLGCLRAIPEADLFEPGRAVSDAASTIADVAASATYRRYDWARLCIERWRLE
jgi:hypothetical protein